MPCVIWGKPGSPIEDIEFKNVSIIARGGHPVIEADIKPAENNERFPRHLGTIPAQAWYLRHVKEVSFTDCAFSVEKDDGRPAFVIDDTEDVVLQSTTIPISSECSSRISVRNQTKNLTVRGCKAMADIRETVRNRNY